MSGITDLYQYSKQTQAVVTFEPLAQTWNLKLLSRRIKPIDFLINLLATSRRARAGVNPEPGTDQFGKSKAHKTLQLVKKSSSILMKIEFQF
jgi:hypothetical protein